MTTADVRVGVATVAGCQRDREWFARVDIHEQVRVIGHTEVGAAVAKTGAGCRCHLCVRVDTCVVAKDAAYAWAADDVYQTVLDTQWRR
jgi:hypothetical protein